MIVNRYIQQSLLLFIASIVLVFLGLHIIMNFSSEFHAIGKGSYTIWRAIEYVLLTSLSDLYQTFPFIALIASLLSIHQLHKHNEIIVMRASGMSMPMLCYAVCSIGIVIVMAATFLGEVIAPNFEKTAFKLKTKATTDNQFMTIKQGFWLHDSNQFIYINKVQSHHKLSGIARYTVNEANHDFGKSLAESAELINGQWHVKNITHHTFTAGGLQQQNFAEQIWSLPLTSNFIQSIILHPEQLSLPKLQQVLQQRQKGGLASADQYLQFWQRVWQPIMTLIMLIFAIPFALGSLRQSSFKLVFGLLFGFGCYFMTHFLSTVAILNGIPAWLSAAIPSMCLLLLAALGAWIQANQTMKLSDIVRRFNA